MATQIDAKAKAMALFSQLANINFGCKGTKAELQANSDRIKTIIESDNVASQKIKSLWDCSWSVVWGAALNYPVLSEPGKYHANNSMFVAKGIDKTTHKNVYVVAVAGTNSLSRVEMFSEDVDVKKVVPWNETNPAQGNISRGSMTGLKKVLGKFRYGSKTTVLNFFEAEVQKNGQENMEIITCGHSLGGALAPLVALKLKETYQNIPVSTYPTAGPTSGDATFAKYAADTLGAGNYISMVNTNDMVPMAWEHDTLVKIPDMYDNDLFGHISGNSLRATINGYAKKTQSLNYTRIAKSTEQTFAGTPESSTQKITFMDEALYQHLRLYMMEFFKNEDAFIAAFRALLHPDSH